MTPYFHGYQTAATRSMPILAFWSLAAAEAWMTGYTDALVDRAFIRPQTNRRHDPLVAELLQERP